MGTYVLRDQHGTLGARVCLDVDAVRQHGCNEDDEDYLYVAERLRIQEREGYSCTGSGGFECVPL